MSNAIHGITKRNANETEFTKHSSLLHILNGEEEFVLNEKGIIISSNLEAVNVTGYEEYEILGKHISIFYRSDEAHKATLDLEKALRLGSTIVTGLRVKKRGVNFWAKMKIKFLASAKPAGPYFIVILQDATHRALSKERIRTLRDEYLSIFNNPFVGTFKFKMNGFGVQMCNPKALEILGVENPKNLRFDNLFASLRQFELFIALLKEQKKVEGFKFQIQDNRSLQENWAVISARYFENHGFAEGVLFDITEQYSQMIELQRLNSELDSFIYHASHDLRSPLTSIMGLVNLGMKENCADAMHNYFGMVQGRINHLDILLKDLISVSYNNSAEQEFEAFDFEPEVDAIVKLLMNPDRPFKVEVEVIQKQVFKTDPVRMRTILRNLISNSFKYFNPEVKEPMIQLTVRVRSSHCAILLKDNGIGIHQEFKQKVYGMFFRGTERSSGSGLGLYIVKSMVDKLKGRISFESTLNVGTTFLVTIPNHTSKENKTIIGNSYMLSSTHIDLVENSWDLILLRSQDTGAIFYRKLFSMDPSLRQLFSGEIGTQAQKLVAMITFAVHKLDNLEEVINDVKALGVHHKKHFVRQEHYAIVGEALLWTLERVLGEEWNPEIKDAWTAVYDTLARIMLEASQG